MDAFWTSWVLRKTYEEFTQLYIKLSQEFPDTIFPEVPESPLYTEGLEPHRTKRSSFSRPKILNFASGPKAHDREHDSKFLQCLIREFLRSSKVAQVSQEVILSL